MDRWTHITEDTNSLVPILPKTGTAMDRLNGHTEDRNSHRTMDGREWTDITEDTAWYQSYRRNSHGPKRMDITQTLAMDGRD